MDASSLRLVAENPCGGRPITLDTTSNDPVDPELVFNGCDLSVQEVDRQAGHQRRAVKKGSTGSAPEAESKDGEIAPVEGIVSHDAKKEDGSDPGVSRRKTKGEVSVAVNRVSKCLRNGTCLLRQ